MMTISPLLVSYVSIDGHTSHTIQDMISWKSYIPGCCPQIHTWCVLSYRYLSPKARNMDVQRSHLLDSLALGIGVCIACGLERIPYCLALSCLGNCVMVFFFLILR
ncbi:uncharacterized protein BDW47DRAFT_27849 [Aspergillus candidus]|uniref:Uncharacterized protein n=1 Tax=Aspergillus candidus TaxID=41067 RepID=A0A2I2FCF0_ASPCN|nr:hypothetical protein BDW47DRAFT_27849 [Aspergillus candidus]PLB38311.1 hypothetical protein BDW47DRAFT_27849 [Aspergillus candidus]